MSFGCLDHAGSCRMRVRATCAAGCPGHARVSTVHQVPGRLAAAGFRSPCWAVEACEVDGQGVAGGRATCQRSARPKHWAEVKLAGANGEHCRPWSLGALSARHVVARSVIRIGKESSRLSESSEPIDDVNERAVTYLEPSACRGPSCGQRLKRRQRDWCSEACRKRASRQRCKEAEAPVRRRGRDLA